MRLPKRLRERFKRLKKLLKKGGSGHRLTPELRAPMPSPTIAHKNKRKYERQTHKQNTKKEFEENG